jgi:hypothetical protein
MPLNITPPRADEQSMAQYETVIEVPVTPEAAFAYLADVTNAAAWDPSVVVAERLDDGPIGEGSRFRLQIAFFGRRIERTTTIARHAAPSELVLVGSGKAVESRETFTLTAHDGGTRIAHDAHLRLKGAMRVLDRGLQLPFTSMGERAAAGLASRLVATG